MDRTRNAAYSYGYPGFESQSLRKEGHPQEVPFLLCSWSLTQGFFPTVRRQSRNESQSLRNKEGNRMRLPFSYYILLRNSLVTAKLLSAIVSQKFRYCLK